MLMTSPPQSGQTVLDVARQTFDRTEDKASLQFDDEDLGAAVAQFILGRE